jgi:CRISPR-associated protein Cas1
VARWRGDQIHTEAFARSFVLAKTRNQRTVLCRALRDHGDGMAVEAKTAVEAAERRLTDIARRAQKDLTADGLRGLEGEAAAACFSVLDHLLRGDEPSLRFRGRSRRPPLDPVNALLSLLYTLVTHDCRSALETFGLDPAVGFLHRDCPGRPSLALDLLEEFRPVLADRLMLSLLNRRQLGPTAFRRMENGAVLLTDEARRAVIVAFQERKQEELLHPYLQEKAPLGLMPQLQAQLLARHLRAISTAIRPSSGNSPLLVLVIYDVSTETPTGRRRLRRVAKACKDLGQRVQLSVFECDVAPAQWVALKARLTAEIDPATDSLRFYFLGSNWKRRVEHVGAKPAVDFDGPLVM